MSGIRIWTLWRMTDMSWRSVEHKDIGGPRKVIELEPILDMLHQADSAMRIAMATTSIAKSAREEFGASFREIDNFLREHGRVV